MDDATFGSDKAAFGSNKASFRLFWLLRSLQQPPGRPCYCLKVALSLPQGGIFSMISQPGTVSSPIIILKSLVITLIPWVITQGFWNSSTLTQLHYYPKISSYHPHCSTREFWDGHMTTWWQINWSYIIKVVNCIQLKIQTHKYRVKFARGFA